MAKWQEVASDTWVMPVPGGWLYRHSRYAYGAYSTALAFVPDNRTEQEKAYGVSPR